MSVYPHAIDDLDSFDDLIGSTGVRLEILRGAARHRIRPVVVPVFLIGSGCDWDLVLADPGMPVVHSYLCLSEDSVSVRNLGHEPPLKVNGRMVESAMLADDDQLELGDYRFAVHIEMPAGERGVESPSRRAMQLGRAAGLTELRLYRGPELGGKAPVETAWDNQPAPHGSANNNRYSR